uniref:Uncharacterized protein n=1 Tax=viral metagenome TaxID=1070528 RepID=A0A6M3J966_9ZZZZ
MTTKDRLIAKLTSARFVFVLVVAFVFAYLSIAGMLPTDKITEIILLVFYAYFSRTDRKG